MTAAYAARASRQTVILAAIAGLHAGAFILVASGLGPGVLKLDGDEPPIKLVPRDAEPVARVTPEAIDPIDGYLLSVPRPDMSLIPKFDDLPDGPRTNDESAGSEAGGGTAAPAVEYQPPYLRTRDARLASLIGSCYPAASRRAGEEGRVVAKIAIDATGRAVGWSVAESSGFARLDAALECVIGRLQFVEGRRDGSAVAAEALLPIVFRLE